jgi:hypothetical protein
MKERAAGTKWILRVTCLLVLAPFWVSRPVRGQETPAPEASSANGALAAAESSQAAPGTEPGNGEPAEPGAGADQGSAVLSPQPSSDLTPSDADLPNMSYFRSSRVNSGGLDPLTGQPAEVVTTNADPFASRPFGLDFDQYPKVGGAEAQASLQIPATNSIPFIYQRFAPDDAQLKAGPFYLKFERLEADFFYQEFHQTSPRRQSSETLAIISLNMTLIAQLTEDLQIAVNGTLIYLPIQNIVGLETTRLNGDFLFFPLPLFLGQVVYDTVIAGWPVRFQDQAGSGTGNYSDSANAAFNLFGGSYLQLNNGRYTFHTGHVDLRANTQDNVNGRDNDYFLYFYNTLSASTERYLEDDILFTATASRTDLWYNQDNQGLPTSLDDLFMEAQSVRENLRFKPFVSYEVSHSSDLPGVYQRVYAGLSGPITDQLFLYSAVGYYFATTGGEGSLWNLTLLHTAGTNTFETLQVERSLNDFNDDVVTTEYYRIEQRFGPTLYGTAFAANSSFQELSGNNLSNSTRQDFGAELTWALGPLTRLTLSGIYSRQDFDDGTLDTIWTGRAELDRNISDTLVFSALYQFQMNHQNRSPASYYEEFMYLALTKYFR